MEGQSISKQNYYLFDFLKVLFAICVVAIHSGLILDFHNQIAIETLGLLESCAVPCFFCISGFLLAKAIDGKSNAEITREIKQLRIKYIKLYFYLNLLYLPLTLYGIIRSYCFENLGIIKIGYRFIKGLLFTGEQFYSWPLWYLLSFIYATCFLLLLVDIIRRKEIRILLCISALCLLVSIIFEYLVTQDPLPGVLLYAKKAIGLTIVNGRLFTGLIYLLAGLCVYFVQASEKVIWAIFCVTIISTFLFEIVFEWDYSGSVFPALIVPVLTKVASTYRKPVNTIVWREYSKYTYYSHMFFVFFWTFNLLTFEEVRQKGIICFVVSMFGVTAVFLISQSIRMIQKRSRT